MKRLCVLLVLLSFLVPSFAMAETESDYVIGDGDGLSILVWGAEELSSQVTVRPDGKITLPAAGDVTATGFTPEQLSKELAEKLEDFVKNPIVTVSVTGITNNKVYVFGGGASSGAFDLPRRTTLLKFLATLGGIEKADLERAYIMRDGNRLDIDFYDLYINGQLERDVPLQSEDLIYIPDNELMKIYVMGAVENPQYIFYRDGIRVLDAILECGGFTKFAKESKVLILREVDDEMAELRVNAKDLMKDGDLSQNIELQRGDLVIVQEGLF
ncbi:polysaccharide biosynthesis/export family protein [Geoalkalibacter subterraneus]|uniref:Sugar ABC transporter substrate-binding protein n=1 Tax=Geoalkalibacter subterraneus TaxID=483547 RepID=A0A0B5FQV5_9BACT|nr:polysaccharide biosynthesis/export family protein [Geoalkalibacter subterraneus]AJF06485.1 sugar ABC transporter substrate-binding protein [Geoalkalibacter subterraneus]